MQSICVHIMGGQFVLLRSSLLKKLCKLLSVQKTLHQAESRHFTSHKPIGKHTCRWERVDMQKISKKRYNMHEPSWAPWGGTVVWFETTTYTNISLQRLIGHPKKEKQKIKLLQPVKKSSPGLKYKKKRQNWFFGNKHWCIFINHRWPYKIKQNATSLITITSSGLSAICVSNSISKRAPCVFLI